MPISVNVKKLASLAVESAIFEFRWSVRGALASAVRTVLPEKAWQYPDEAVYDTTFRVFDAMGAEQRRATFLKTIVDCDPVGEGASIDLNIEGPNELADALEEAWSKERASLLSMSGRSNETVEPGNN